MPRHLLLALLGGGLLRGAAFLGRLRGQLRPLDRPDLGLQVLDVAPEDLDGGGGRLKGV